MPMDPPPDLATLSLADIAKLAAERKLPPVEQWNPTHCGHSGMRIARDGTWFHEGSPIGRKEMVRLFSTVLRREPDGSHVLVTPVEKLDIDVEDAPFIAIAMQTSGEGQAREIAFSLNTGDLVLLDGDHALSVRHDENGPRPYVAVRGGLEARIGRNVYYELAAIAIEEGAGAEGANGEVGVWSHGRFFPLGGAEDGTGDGAA
ncbi:DUF1285 domain-containing protein [Sphingobium sufflavum]|uniref:DUF1285 domain-containing protein n=1 Tax=Sphingobium sufflavum TaxID=1129547 RepID=UPI001F2602B8|nr:DUF1285 domain-containing protein [Sphingobium sufflavum]MCE7794998.1 DUF1285 domain-containing protein [Sphingobium sufflavum]